MGDNPKKTSVGWGAKSAGGGPAWFGNGWAAPQPTQDLNVARTESLVSPREMKRVLPMTVPANQTVVESREAVKNILSGTDPRLLVIIGPCSIHDEQAALEYARKLSELRRRVNDKLVIVMRVYFEKPRTTIGWKGLINDPHLDGTFDMQTGLQKARHLLLSICELGLPTSTEMLEPITPQYIADLVTWSAVGARTTESQTHRQMASGLSMPVGFKNATDGNLQIAIDAMQSARSPHGFLGIDQEGRTAIIRTRGNAWGHVILRGGRSGPNYSPEHVAGAIESLDKAGLPTGIMIDCSHANAEKKFQNQVRVWNSIVDQRLAGNNKIIGTMIESNLFEGNQKMNSDRSALKYGVSITDQCIGWEETEAMLLEGADRLKL